MNEQDKPTFWEKLAAFVLTCLVVAGAVTLVRMGLVGVMGVCK